MIKLVLFDLDGVLVDTKQIHFDALNESYRSTSSNRSGFQSCKFFNSASEYEASKLVHPLNAVG